MAWTRPGRVMLAAGLVTATLSGSAFGQQDEGCRWLPPKPSLSRGSILCSLKPTGPIRTALKAFSYSRSQFLSVLVRSSEAGSFPSLMLVYSPVIAAELGRGQRSGPRVPSGAQARLRKQLDERSSLGKLNGGLLKRKLLEKVCEVVLPDRRLRMRAMSARLIGDRK